MKTFTTILATVLGMAVGAFAQPPVPTLTTPAQNATGVPTTTSLIWTASTGATSYRLQLSRDSLFATTVVNDSTLTATNFAVAALVNDAIYYWRVNAKDGSGTSAFSTIGKFTTLIAAPTLSFPGVNATNIPLSTTLIWRLRVNATSYRVQFSADSNFVTTLVDTTLADTTRAVGPLVSGTFYYWRINASNAGGTSAFSARRRFTTIPAAPAAPVLTSPAPGAVGVPDTTSLTWAASVTATSYRVQLSTDSTFTTTLLNDSVTTLFRATSSLASNTVYYWRVNARNLGGISAYSPTQSFTTRLPAPTLSSPAQNAIILATSVNLSWTASPTATSYRVQLSYNSTFTNLALNDSNVTATSRNYPNLTYGITYYWRVSAKNAAGTSAYSTTGIFTTSTVGILPKEISLQRLTIGKDQAFRFSLPRQERVVIKVFNSQGRMVSQLLDETRDAGSYAVPLSAGLNGSAYFLDFQAGNFHQTMKINR